MELVAEELACRRAGRLVFQGISFSVRRGEAALLHGPNGSGKSSLLRLMAGLLKAERGDVWIDGQSLRADSSVFQSYLTYAGHLDGIKPQLTVLENLRLWGRIYGADPALRPRQETDRGQASAAASDDAPPPPTDRLEEALEKLGIRQIGSFPAAYCSAGQKRRLALARLLVVDRPVWLLDEPTVSLDVEAVETFAGLVRDHLESGGMAIAATHVPLGLPHTQTIVMGEEAPARDRDDDDETAPALPDDPFLEGDWR